MKVGIVGVGAMGVLMAGHMVKKGHAVAAFDIDKKAVADAKAAGATGAASLPELAKLCDVILIMVGNDSQLRQVVGDLVAHMTKGSRIVVTGTHHIETMRELAKVCGPKGIGLVDAPVVFGMDGARDGKLLSLCGGSEEDFNAVKPALLAYSRDALRVGPLGAGQLGKACNNLMHWIHCVANYEVLALAKRYGVDAQRMREVLLQAPADNNTLQRWDHTKFTWQEKDMDLVMDLAQSGGLMLPLTGTVDQLVKKLKADDVKELLYGPTAHYLGVEITPLPPEKGGLGK